MSLQYIKQAPMLNTMVINKYAGNYLDFKQQMN